MLSAPNIFASLPSYDLSVSELQRNVIAFLNYSVNRNVESLPQFSAQPQFNSVQPKPVKRASVLVGIFEDNTLTHQLEQINLAKRLKDGSAQTIQRIKQQQDNSSAPTSSASSFSAPIFSPTSSSTTTEYSATTSSSLGVDRLPFQHPFSSLHVLLTVRSSKLKSFSGQVALPGGKSDANDLDEIDTALRESEEEIGLPRHRVRVLAKLPWVWSRDMMRVTPVLALIPRPVLDDVTFRYTQSYMSGETLSLGSFHPRLNADEVESLFVVPLSAFITNDFHRTTPATWRGVNFHLQHFIFNTYHYVGAEQGPLKRKSDHHPPSRRTFDIFGMTAILCVFAAGICYRKQPPLSSHRVSQGPLSECKIPPKIFEMKKKAQQKPEETGILIVDRDDLENRLKTFISEWPRDERLKIRSHTQPKGYAAVLVGIYPAPTANSSASSSSSSPHTRWNVLLIQRAAGLASHAGDVAFPGGTRDPNDDDDIATALREAEEEVGLHRDGVQILGALPWMWSQDLMLVTPIVAFIPQPIFSGDSLIPRADEWPSFQPKLNSSEVAFLFAAPLDLFLFDVNHAVDIVPWRGASIALHHFLHRTQQFCGAASRSTNDASAAAPSMSQQRSFDIFGFTALVLIYASIIAYQQKPNFPLFEIHRMPSPNASKDVAADAPLSRSILQLEQNSLTVDAKQTALIIRPKL